uniref:DUF6589 domain-containing protein n=1 Tax=Mycena chlorophos TaxID=658473 RepID=A0ABQ0KWX5_MYCCL|nr:predicted protein [Mycena chlorophos]
MQEWIIGVAENICNYEASTLTDQASSGQNYEAAKSLRVPAKSANIQLVKEFSLPKLIHLYGNTMPSLQQILKAVIGKEQSSPDTVKRTSRKADMGRAMVTSCLLNLRSRETNLHQTINSLLLWHTDTSKTVVRMLNHYGICTSPVHAIGQDGVRLAREAANDPKNLLLLPNDNFNWVGKAWESSSTHGNVTHDQVSAMLVVLQIPPGTDPNIASVANFERTLGARHSIPAEQALEEIMPTAEDQLAFGRNSIAHVAHILSEELTQFSGFRSRFHISDAQAIPPMKTQEYYLPTYDQEQTSTRGNMKVMEHFLLEVLKIPREKFEERFYFLLRDRMTTSRERAAQDQRLVERSELRVDTFSSLGILSGLMHFVFNMIENIGKNMMGTKSELDAVSLRTCLEKLPNRGNINVRQIDFYAWLRFLDVVLRALVLQAAIFNLHLNSTEALKTCRLDEQKFDELCTKIAAQFVLPSIDRLEAEGLKTIVGNSQSGNAILLMHDLMTIREMRQSIKWGHPERMQRMLKFWTPMFYGGGSYNYANEGMELLHNLIHDWPSDVVPILRNGMFMNTQGKPGKFKETDLGVEHFNNKIKSHTGGVNAAPGALEKITPAIGHIQELREKVFEDLGLDDHDHHHAKVTQHEDVWLLLAHFNKAHIFDFKKDISSEHTVVDLFRSGLWRLAGSEGGHAKHLQRHLLRRRIRDSQLAIDFPTLDEMQDELEDLNWELEMDKERPEVSLIELVDRAWAELDR